MKDTLTGASRLLGSAPDLDAARCRKLAAEARATAANTASAEVRAAYLELMTHWNMLADEIEVAEQPSRVLFSSH
jgi:hypothetical protein